MFLMKLKSALNILGFAGIRVLVVSSAMLGSLMVVYSGYSLYEQAYTQNRAFDSGIREFADTTELQDAQSSLAEAREDYRAWLRVTDTHIDYPVMQGKDDLYYASHDVDGKTSLTGAIYMASDNKADLSDNYIIIFGHHMDNGAMFGDLDHFLTASYFEAHQEGFFVYPGGTYDIRFFAAMKTDAYDETIYQAGSRNLEELIAYIGEHAEVQKPLEAKAAEKVIALSTCADAQTNGRLLVFGVMTPHKDEPAPEPSITEAQPSKEPEPTDEPKPTEPEPTKEPEPTAVVSGAVEPTGKPIEVSPSAPPQPTITSKPNGGPDAPKTGEHSSWLSRFFDRFLPGGSSYGLNAWALLNLVCVYVTLYILFPFHRIRGKYGRIDKMRRLNSAKEDLWNAADLTPAQLAEREEIMALARRKYGRKTNAEVTEEEFDKAVESRYYRVNRFAFKFRLGIAIEAVLAAVSVITFFNTENMRLPMILIDKWTPLMLLLAVTAFVADLALTRYRENGAEESERA